MQQQELQLKEEVRQQELQKKEEVRQQELQKREEVRQQELQQKEEVRQQELQLKEEVWQQELQKREEVRQMRLQEEEELALVKLKRVLALKISSLVSPGSYLDAHIAEILNLYIQTRNNERKLNISTVLEFYRILPEQVRHTVESHNSLAGEDIIQDEAFIYFVQKFPHLFSIVGEGRKTVIYAIVDGKRPNDRNLSFSAYSCGYSSLPRTSKDPRFTIIPHRVCMILDSRIGTARWGGYSTSIDIGVGINVKAQVEVGVEADESNGSKPMLNEEVRSITQIIADSDVVKNAEQEPLQAVGTSCTSTFGKVTADARGRVVSANMIGKTDGFDYSHGHKVACDDSDDELEEMVFYNKLDMPSYSFDSYLGKKAPPEVSSPSPLPGPTTYSLRHYYIPINRSSSSSASSTHSRLSSSPSLLLPSSSSFFSPKVAPSPASHPTGENDDRNPGTEEDDEIIHIKGKRRRGVIRSLNSLKETENSPCRYKKSMSQNCLASKMKRCRAFDLELGDVEDADELCQIGAERIDRMGNNNGPVRPDIKNQNMREGNLRSLKKVEEGLSSIPHSEGLSSTPHLEVLSSTPHLESLSSTPHSEGLSSTPHLEGLSSTPHLESLSSIPH